MVKKISRILLEEFQNIDEFAKAVVENVDIDVLKILIETPLYRGVSNIKGQFGRKEIRTDRKPYTNYMSFHLMLERELVRKGFCARRTNSIFATGKLSLAENFGTKIVTVFPPKSFCFTWNRLLRDITFMNTIRVGGYREIKLDVEKAVKLIGVDFAEVAIRAIKDRYGPYAPDSVMEKLNRLAIDVIIDKKFTDEHKNEFLNIWHFVSEKAPKLLVKIVVDIFEGLNSGYGRGNVENAEKIAQVFSFSENSKVINAFSNSDFEEAVKSGHEIMIHAPYFFYATRDVYRSVLRDKLKELISKVNM